MDAFKLGRKWKVRSDSKILRNAYEKIGISRWSIRPRIAVTSPAMKPPVEYHSWSWNPFLCSDSRFHCPFQGSQSVDAIYRESATGRGGKGGRKWEIRFTSFVSLSTHSENISRSLLLSLSAQVCFRCNAMRSKREYGDAILIFYKRLYRNYWYFKVLL